MLISILTLVSISINLASPVFLDGDSGYYTSSASFNKVKQMRICFRESYGIKGEKEDEKRQTQNQLNFYINYTLFRFVEIGSGINYFSMEGTEFTGGFLKAKFPVLTMQKIKLSLAPCFTFAKEEKSYLSGDFNIDIIPFTKENLPSFLFGESVNVGRKNGTNILQSSSLILLNTSHFQPFIEFYTEFFGDISTSAMYNTRLCSGLGFKVGFIGFRAGVEIPLSDYTKRDSDIRFTGEINFLLDTKIKPAGKLVINVLDMETQVPVSATIKISGKDEEKIFESIDGKFIIENLSFGIYTIEIINPEYKRLKAPVFIKKKLIEKTYKIKKM